MGSVRTAYTNLESSPSGIKEQFNQLLATGLGVWLAKRDKEEQSIMNE